MKQSLALVIAASVLVMTALTAIMLSGSSFTDLQDSADQQQQTKCEFQYEQYRNCRASYSDLSEECRNPDSQEMQEKLNSIRSSRQLASALGNPIC
ncbi:MAG: hypothetical protein ABEJ91_03305 [Candidatus Nanohaloarchaea archaeon]